MVGFRTPVSGCRDHELGWKRMRPRSRGGILFAMAEAIGLESLRWMSLVLPSVARFTVVVDASIVDVALGA